MTDLDEVIAKLCSADEQTLNQLNRIADYFRGGADLRTLIPLLRHSNARVVDAGAWIASEVVDSDYGNEIFDDLAPLLDHPDPYVRFNAVRSISLLVSPEDQSVVRQLFLRAVDPNAGVRGIALRYLCWVPDEVVESLRDTEMWPSASLMAGSASKEEILAALRSNSLFDQRMAILAAMRNFGNDDDFIQTLVPMLDGEVAKCLPKLPRNRGDL